MLEMMPVVTLDAVSKSFAGRSGPVRVLTDASLTVPFGEMLAIVGPNGVGKSTVLRLVAGLLLPDAGTVRVTDGDAALLDPARRSGLVSALFDGSRGLYWKLTVAENLRYFGALEGVSAADVLRAARPWLERFGLMAKLDELVESLSKGTQQKVAIVRALALPRPVMLFDEPTVLLDDHAVTQLALALREQCRAGAAVVLATHDREFVAQAQARQVTIAPERGFVPLPGKAKWAVDMH
jgi:ABC-2 type transport system ATP-binding protein